MDSYTCACGYQGQDDLTRPVTCKSCGAVLRIERYMGGFQTVERKNESGGWTFIDMGDPTKPRMIV